MNRLNRTSPGPLSWTVALGIVLGVGACSSDSPGTGSPVASETAQATSDVIICGAFQEPGEGGRTVAKTEWYSTVAINNKLRHFPEFAAFAGQTSVRDCASGERFFERYDAYLAAHPDFDAHEPMEMPNLVVTRPQGPLEPDEVPKILNADYAKLAPVVKIIDPAGNSCTGTFIAKNWILTAAHCLQPGVSEQADAAPVDDSVVNTWYSWKVVFSGSGGVGLPPKRFPYVLQYKEPRYAGFRRTSLHPFDIGLLYILDVSDGSLPFSTPTPPAPNGLGPFMRLTASRRASSTLSTSTTAWGCRLPKTYGSGPPTEAGLTNVSWVGDMTSYLPSMEQHGGEITAIIPAIDAESGQAFNGPYLCKGDSGGPLADRATFGGSFNEPTAYGVYSSGTTDPVNPLCGLTTTAGGQETWTSVPDEIDFIRRTIVSSNWYPGLLGCHARTADGNSGVSYDECFGKACKTSGDCNNPSREYCYRPGTDLKNSAYFACTVCPIPGDCSCIYGQCIDREK